MLYVGIQVTFFNHAKICTNDYLSPNFFSAKNDYFSVSWLFILDNRWGISPTIFPKLPLMFIWHCKFTCVFYWLTYLVASYLFTMTHARSVQFLVAHDLFRIPSRKERNTNVLIIQSYNIKRIFGVTVEVYFTRMLQVKYIPVSTGEPIWYLCTVIFQLGQIHTIGYNGIYR